MERINGNPESRAQSGARIVLAAQARAAAGSTAFAAALLLYFGFSSLEPGGKDLGDWSLWILFYTLRFGGLACAALAIVLFLGVGAALIADAIVSSLIGVLLILTGAGLGIGGGTLMQAAINVVCGFMFASYGFRTGLQYVAIRGANPAAKAFAELNPTDSNEDIPDRPAPKQPAATRESDSTSNAIEALRAQKVSRQSANPSNPTSGDAKPTDFSSEEGFLAALAKKQSPKGDPPGAA